MNAYLNLAEKILREARRPLSAREILRRAYPAGRVPRHLHGKTQHKTLGARLSMDILEHGEKSIFFRNEPGRFFLTEFISDTSIPQQFRHRFVARRRRRLISHPKPMAIHQSSLPDQLVDGAVSTEAIFDLIRQGDYHYPVRTNLIGPNDVVVWSFVVVARGSQILTYRHGDYREARDAFRHQRAVGFFAPVLEGDRTLFDLEDHGIVQRGINTISIDLGLATSIDLATTGNPLASLRCFVPVRDQKEQVLLSVIRYDAPEWFEPYARKLALNDLQWLEFDKVVLRSETLDPWSSAVINASPHILPFPTVNRG
ncbi:MAG: winged helix-turn-helix domain-containing protein [Sphingomonadales bacterium]|nr:winged helix-turn-helix domain-containing protein [Sphingomonadales bacterium]MDE2169595.1 winged helix-turn-helix domain-containing protein [Sphingomonadales bacterium]